MNVTPEPKDKLGTMMGQRVATVVRRAVVVNGPEDVGLKWDAVNWRAAEDDVVLWSHWRDLVTSRRACAARRSTAVIEETSAGGVAVNATVLHLAVPGLPFGGVGASGTGAYHGRAGFETFSHRKSVLNRPTRLDVPVMYPPYKGWKQKLLHRLLAQYGLLHVDPMSPAMREPARWK